MIPFLIFAVATIGLNPPHRLCRSAFAGDRRVHGGRRLCLLQAQDDLPRGQLSVLRSRVGVLLGGIGIVFGLPSLRIKGLYLAVTTLAAQFFLEWCFIRIPWLNNYNASGAIQVSTREAFGVIVAGPAATPTTRYFIVLAIAVVVTLLVKNILRGHISAGHG